MVGYLPDHRLRVAVNRQVWTSLTFLHYPVPARALRPLLPAQLEPDTFDGKAWVSLTPFLMDFFGTPVLPVPLASRFVEVNVRTYVRGPDGRDGIWFFSLECSRLQVTAALRLLGLPYQRSRTGMATPAVAAGPGRRGPVRYRSRRIDGRGHFAVEVDVGEALDPGPLENFLTGRWNAYSHAWGQLWRTPIVHEPWPLRRARARGEVRDLLGVNSLPEPGQDLLAHFSPGVDVHIGVPRLVSTPGRGR